MATKVKWAAPRDEHGRLIVDAYLRMSDGFGGKEDNRENQLADIMPIFERNGWALGEVLQDEVSAWKRGTRRDDFEKLLVRIETGGSAGVVFYNQDRLLRRPMDLERFLLLWEDGREEMVAASAYGAINLNDGQQRAFMRNVASMAMSASDDTSRRSRRKNDGKRERGIQVGGGPRAFGWPGKDVAPERLESEQEALKTAYANIAEGGKVQAEVDRLNAAELLSFYGRPWTPTTLRNTMKRGRYAGRIEHDGEVVGVMADHDPLIDAEIFDRVQAIFASRKRGRPTTARSVGSGNIECSLCGQVMRGRPRYTANRTVQTYFCNKQTGGCGRMVIDQAPVDAMLREVTARVLSDSDVAERTSAFLTETADRRKQVEAFLAQAEEQMVALSEKLAADQLLPRVWEAHNAALMARYRTHEAELAELDVMASDRSTVERMSREEILACWDAAYDSDREVCRDLLVSAIEHMRVQILPGRRGGAIPTEERIDIIPR